MKILTKSAAFISLIAMVSGCSKDKVSPASSGLSARARQLNSGPVTVTSISPASGINYTAVTITGSNFDAVTTNDTVKFNGVKAVVNSATSTQIVATVPPFATTGRVTVSTSGSSASAPTAFKVVHYVKSGSISFANPILALAFDKIGNIYGIQNLVSSNHYAIVKYANGAFTTLYKTLDDTITFNPTNGVYNKYTYNLEGLATDSKGNIYTALAQANESYTGSVVDTTVYHTSILKITPAGNVSVLGGNSQPFGLVFGLVVDGNDNIYIGATSHPFPNHYVILSNIYIITPTGSTVVLYTESDQDVWFTNLAIDKSNNLYFVNFISNESFYQIERWGSLVWGQRGGYITSLSCDGFNNMIIGWQLAGVPTVILINSAGWGIGGAPPFIGFLEFDVEQLYFDNYGNAYKLTPGGAIIRYSLQ